MTTDELGNLNTIRQFQVYAALCLRRFCLDIKVDHQSIDELFRHLVSIATTENLAKWEQQGLKIELVGRGNPVPESLASTIPGDHLNSFTSLVENSVEVGLVDMYGAPSEKPRQFMTRCVAILQQAGVNLPTVGKLHQYGRSSDGWGTAIKEKELDELLAL